MDLIALAVLAAAARTFEIQRAFPHAAVRDVSACIQELAKTRRGIPLFPAGVVSDDGSSFFLGSSVAFRFDMASGKSTMQENLFAMAFEPARNVPVVATMSQSARVYKDQTWVANDLRGAVYPIVSPDSHQLVCTVNLQARNLATTAVAVADVLIDKRGTRPNPVAGLALPRGCFWQSNQRALACEKTSNGYRLAILTNIGSVRPRELELWTIDFETDPELQVFPADFQIKTSHVPPTAGSSLSPNDYNWPSGDVVYGGMAKDGRICLWHSNSQKLEWIDVPKKPTGWLEYWAHPFWSRGSLYLSTSSRDDADGDFGLYRWDSSITKWNSIGPYARIAASTNDRYWVVADSSPRTASRGKEIGVYALDMGK